MPQPPLSAMALGTEILVCLAVGSAAGAWLDQRTDLRPLFTLIGLAAGVGAVVKGLLRSIRAYARELEEGGNDDRRDDAGSNDGGS